MLEINIEGSVFCRCRDEQEKVHKLSSLTFQQGIEFLVVILSYPKHDAENSEGVLGAVPFAYGTGDVLSVFRIEVHEVEL